MKVLLSTIFLVTSLNIGQSGNWEYIGDMLKPVAGGTLTIWQDTNEFYILGGYSDSLQSIVSWNQGLGFTNYTWNLSNMSTPRFGFVSSISNNIVYSFGGVSDSLSSIFAMEHWNLNEDEELVFSHNNNFNRIFSTGHIIGDNYYIIGGNPFPGTGSDSLPYIVEYNIPQSTVLFKTDSLFISEELPEQQMSAVIGDNIYIFGGVINGISQNIYKFNVINHTYEELSIKLQEPRAGGRAIIGREYNKIYIVGGYNEDNLALNSVEIFYEFGDDYVIEKGSSILEARYHFMSGYLNESLYIMGGYDKNGNVISSIEKMDEAVTTHLKDEFLFEKYTFELEQNYPNPFNPSTTIKYSIPKVETQHAVSLQNIKLTVYDILGKEVITLVNEIKQPGNHDVTFDASKLTSGIYLYQLKTNSFVQTKKMIFIK